MKLTKKYLKSVKDKLVTIPLMWIDRDYPVELEWHEVKEQDTNGVLEIWVYYSGSLMCRIDNIEQLEAMYFGIFGKKIICTHENQEKIDYLTNKCKDCNRLISMYESEYEKELLIEKGKFEENKEEYLKSYEGKYIALYKGEVLDSDKDFSELAKRRFKNYKYEWSIYMPLVTRKEIIYKIPTIKLYKNK